MIEDIEKTPNEILDEAIGRGFTDFYVAYSGGKDSGIVLDLISKEYPDNFKGVIFVDTGIATNDTIEFVKDWCDKHKYPLNMLHASDVKRVRKSEYGKIGDPFTFENLVLNFGFPTAGGHGLTMGWLKYYPMRKFIHGKIKDGENPCVISGVRKKESKRRSKRKSYQEYINQDGKMTFVTPLYYKSNDWVMKYYITHDIKRSPVYETLHISGDCLCGCFAKESELELLKMFHPEVYKEIQRLEKLVRERGTEEAQRFLTWGNHDKSTLHVESNDAIESAVCSECFFDNGDKNEGDDTSYLHERTPEEKAKMTLTPEEQESRRKRFKEQLKKMGDSPKHLEQKLEKL